MANFKSLDEFHLCKTKETQYTEEAMWWVKINAHIKEVSSGEVRVYETEEPIYLVEGGLNLSVFNWEDNNYSCDCNRRIFFERANGIEIEFDEYDCSDGGFLVNLENPKTGEIYYREFEA